MADSAKSYNDIIGPGAEMERCLKRVAGVACRAARARESVRCAP